MDCYEHRLRIHGARMKGLKPGSLLEAKPYLIDITILRDDIKDMDEYPFSIPSIRGLETLAFHPDVTYFIGENGTGKSTLMEAIAKVMGFNPEGGTKNSLFATRDTHSNLADFIKPGRSFKAARDGFFLRAESFYNLASYIDEVQYNGSYGGKSLHEQSHGESFLALLTQKFRGNGLYLLDEPEAALSPSRQLSALAVIHKLVRANSQFIIATHSPILMAYPNSRIYLFSDSGIHEVAYEDTDHFRVAKDFLNHREQVLSVLFEEDE
jgi:predicted ATPase